MVDMEALTKDETLTNIGINTTTLANFARLVVCRDIDNKGFTPGDSDDSSTTIRITPYFESIWPGKIIYLPNILTGDIQTCLLGK